MLENWDFWEMILRATGAFFVLLIMTRLMGRKQLSQLTFFNYDGQAFIVIKKGKILEGELAKRRLNIDDLSMLLREQKVFSVKDVENAVFEPNGKLSIMLKEEKQPVTKKDQNIFTVAPTYIPMELISDGKVIEKKSKRSRCNAELVAKPNAFSGFEY